MPFHHSMLGMRLDYIGADDFIDKFSELASRGKAAYACVPDVYQCMVCHGSEGHRAIVNNADFVISDSTILQRARALRHGVAPIRAVLGSDLMLLLCARAAHEEIRVALIGGRDDTVLAALEAALTRDFPKLRIVYAYSPPFRALRADEEQRMLDGLETLDARLVFIGLGCPKQEQWMGRYRDRVHAAMIGVGAAFDTISGTVPSSPAVVHSLGLEWLFRLAREPRRLYRRYLVYAPQFVGLLVFDWIRSAVRARPGAAGS